MNHSTLFVVIDLIVLAADLAWIAAELYVGQQRGTTEVRTATGRKVYGRRAA